jgi:valyl-tRNA synthetase
MSQKTPDETPETTPKESSDRNLPKAYDPSLIEQRWAEYWVRERLFEVPTPKAGAPHLDSEMWDEESHSIPSRPTGGPREAAKGPVVPFTMLLPPPNVTGYLHMGHMFEHTESDILVRWRRMSGDTAVWVPGTDHAGIATQMLVERQLKVEGTDRKTLGREAFTERVWAWKRQYGNAITEQMKRLGASVDWSREYFTMDHRLSVAVREAFVRLYEQDLIYRGAYIVNWDPVQQTAVSDLEVNHEERAGKLYHIRYPFADGTGSIVVATTRPETMLGDVAVAVNPNDERYQEHIGKLVTLPLSAAAGHADREIPILADNWAQPEFGTGAVKVTPAHDPNDFAIGQRHSLPSLTIMDETAHIHLPGSPYHGLDRFAARERIVADLEAAGLLVAIKDHSLAIAVSQRTGAVIEPRLSLQWFLAVNKAPPGSNASSASTEGAGGFSPLNSNESNLGFSSGTEVERKSIAQTAIAAVRDGHIKFTPEMYQKTYMEWMTNIHDWCISRQLWWGHRIPAWHCAACHATTVARDTPTACGTCGSTHIEQSTDVLDTWFSSGLLPFTVFGWPGEQGTANREQGTGVQGAGVQGAGNSQQGTEGQGSTARPNPATADPLSPVPYSLIPDPCSLTPDLAAYYPTSQLVTGFDILFFWVARMIMLGCHFMLDVPMPDGSLRPLAEAVPFRNVYIHGLIRDANREKMSKTKGNVVDPIDIIQRFGTDAVRFTLASQASPGTDIAFNEARTEGYRAFANKIWNAARFLFMNLDRAREAGIEIDLRHLDRYRNGGRTPTTGTVRQPGQAPEMIPQWSTQIFINETIESRWIRARLAEVAKSVNRSLCKYRFDDAADAIYQFVWGDFCDWYLEIAKIRLDFESPARRGQTTHAINMLVATFEAALRLLSPFMPFLTEELWHALYSGKPLARSIALTAYPQELHFLDNSERNSDMETLQKVIVATRALRKELGVPEKEFTPLRVNGLRGFKQLIEKNADMLNRLARVSQIEVTPLGSESLSGPGVAQWQEFEVQIIYERQIDIPAERERLTKDLAKYEKVLTANDARLADEKFIAKAPAHIVEGLRKQTDELRTLRDKTRAALDALG